MSKVTLYTKEVCPLCDDALALLLIFQQKYSFEIEQKDIYQNEEWLERYHLRIPVIEIDCHQIDVQEINYASLEMFLKSNLDE